MEANNKLPRLETAAPWSSGDKLWLLSVGLDAPLPCTSEPTLMTFFINHVIFLLSNVREKGGDGRDKERDRKTHQGSTNGEKEAI